MGPKNVIVEGHGRLEAAKKLGMASVPCIRLDHLTDEQRRAYALAHNKTAELSGWDFGTLEEELNQLQTQFDMSDFGFDATEPEVVEDNYTPDVPADSKTRQGDVYVLGRHRLMCGDSTNADDVLRLMGGRPADMLLTDPPYGIDYHAKAGSILNDALESEQFISFLRDAFTAAMRVMRGGAAFHIWFAPSKSFEFFAACRNAGFSIRQVLVWVKNTASLGRQDFQWMHEPCISGEIPFDDSGDDDALSCLYGWKDGAHSWFKKRREKTVLYFDKPAASKEHPTMKPVLLFDYEMQCNTQAGDAVLDLFGGSGTTLIAAEQNGRDAYLMELDPCYCDVIVDRWEKLTGEKAKLMK